MINANEEIKKNGFVFLGKLLDTTNNKCTKYTNVIFRCYIGEVLFLHEENGEKWVRTSLLEDIKYSGNKIYFITLNSIYTIEYIKPIFTEGSDNNE